MCIAELLVKMDEKPGSTPMLETIIPSSFSGTIFRISASSFLISFSVSSRRVPDGAFTRITNWPASVMGKKARPSRRSDEQAREEQASKTCEGCNRTRHGSTHKALVEIERSVKSTVEGSIESRAESSCFGPAVSEPALFM